MRGNWRGIDKKIDYPEQKTESFELFSLLVKGGFFFMQGPNFFLKDFFFPPSADFFHRHGYERHDGTERATNDVATFSVASRDI